MNDDQKNKSKQASINPKAAADAPQGAQPPQAPAGSGLTGAAAGSTGGDHAETVDGKPPGAHAPMGIGTGAPVDNTPVGDRPKDPTQPQNQVDDATISPKEQAEHSLEVDAALKGQAPPVQGGFTRVRLSENVTVNGMHKLAGDTVDLPNADIGSLEGKFERL